MDKFRIQFKCNKRPKPSLGLEGYEPNQKYVGRSYNGVYEIAPSWGTGNITRMVDGKTFEEYFELMDN